MRANSSDEIRKQLEAELEQEHRAHCSSNLYWQTKCDELGRAYGEIKRERDALRVELEAALDALAEIHRVTGRGDGHESPRETAACVIDAYCDATTTAAALL